MAQSSKETQAAATAEAARKAEEGAAATAEAAKSAAKDALKAKMAGSRYPVEIGEAATVTLITPFQQVHPKTRQRFLPNEPTQHVFDGWVKAMVQRKCMKVGPPSK